MGKLRQITIMPFAVLILLFYVVCDCLRNIFEKLGTYLVDIALK